jgi:hypothetical protein
MPSTNFELVDASGANQQSDATYAGDARTTSGFTTGMIVPHDWLSKFIWQQSVFSTAFAEFLVALGYSPNDGSASPSTALASLSAVFGAALLTSPGFAAAFGASSGYVKLPASLGNLIIQWAIGVTDSASVSANDFPTQTINWALAFPNACFLAIASTKIASSTASDFWYQVVGSPTTTGVVVGRARSHNDAGVEGDYGAAPTPLVIALGY